MSSKTTAVAAAIAAALLGATAAQANVITEFTTIYDTNVTYADEALRGTNGVGTLTVTGVTGPVTQSYLWWHGPTNSTDPTANANVTVAGQAVTGTNIGFSQDNFWGELNSQAYRADTTSIINGNGSYSLSNFVHPSNGVDIVNGAAAALFSTPASSSTARDVVIFNGNDSNFASSYDPAGWDFTLGGINYTSGTAYLTLYVSDGQNFGPEDDGTLAINGVTLATGGIFQGVSPGVGVSNGTLTDVETFDITSFLTPGVNNLEVTLSPGFDDALSAVAAFVDLPAGDAPPPPSVPEPATLALMGLGLGALSLARRRRSGKAH